NADGSRVAAQIVSGIGFLGAGAIFRSGPLVKGLTTAAGLWAAAAVGMAAGTGQLLWATVATALGVIILVGLRLLDPVVSLFRRTVSVEATVSPPDEFLRVRESVAEIDPEVDLIGVEARGEDAVVLVFDVHPHEVDLLCSALKSMTFVTDARVQT